VAELIKSRAQVTKLGLKLTTLQLGPEGRTLQAVIVDEDRQRN